MQDTTKRFAPAIKMMNHFRAFGLPFVSSMPGAPKLKDVLPERQAPSGVRWGWSTYQLPDDVAARFGTKELTLAHFVSPLAFRKSRFENEESDQLPVWMPDWHQRSEETIWKQEIVVVAILRRSKIGTATFNRFGAGISAASDPSVWAGYSLNVDEEYRRCGIARAMYGHVKEHEYQVSPSEVLTDDGRALWLRLDPHLATMPERPALGLHPVKNRQTDALGRSLWEHHRPPRTLDWHIRQRPGDLPRLYPDLLKLHQQIVVNLRGISKLSAPLSHFLERASSMLRRKRALDEPIEATFNDLVSIFGHLPKVRVLDRWLAPHKERALQDALVTLSQTLTVVGSQMDLDLKIAEPIPDNIANFVPENWSRGY